jgi:hypothetical protein
METAPITDEWIKKCGIYTQWNFIQPQRRMKFCRSQVNGWNWRTAVSQAQKGQRHVFSLTWNVDLTQM